MWCHRYTETPVVVLYEVGSRGGVEWHAGRESVYVRMHCHTGWDGREECLVAQEEITDVV